MSVIASCLVVVYQAFHRCGSTSLPIGVNAALSMVPLAVMDVKGITGVLIALCSWA